MHCRIPDTIKSIQSRNNRAAGVYGTARARSPSSRAGPGPVGAVASAAAKGCGECCGQCSSHHENIKVSLSGAITTKLGWYACTEKPYSIKRGNDTISGVGVLVSRQCQGQSSDDRKLLNNEAKRLPKVVVKTIRPLTTYPCACGAQS